MAANCGFESMTQLLRDRMVTGTKIAKICSYRYRSCRREYGHTNKRCLLSLNWVLWRREKEQSGNVPSISNSCRFSGRNHKKRCFPLFDHTYAYCKKKNHFVVKYSAKGKVSTVQAMQALETEVVRWWPSLYQRLFQVMMQPSKWTLGLNAIVCLWMSTRRLQAIHAWIQFLNARGKSVLVLAYGDEQPIEGKATVYASRKRNRLTK